MLCIAGVMLVTPLPFFLTHRKNTIDKLNIKLENIRSNPFTIINPPKNTKKL